MHPGVTQVFVLIQLTALTVHQKGFACGLLACLCLVLLAPASRFQRSQGLAFERWLQLQLFMHSLNTCLIPGPPTYLSESLPA